MVLSKIKFLVLFLISYQLLSFSVHSQVSEPLVFSVHPYLPAVEIVKRFTPLVDYLSEETGSPITLHVASSYEDHIHDIGNGRAHIAYLGPASYVKLVDLYGKKQLVARLEINGKPNFQGAIIVRKDSKIMKLKNLEGKRFAFGDPESTMSSLIPQYMLLNEDISLEKLAGYVHLRNHNNVALSVLVGDYDAGAVKEEVYYNYKNRGLKALEWTPSISEHLIVADNSLSSQKLDSLKKALFNLKNNQRGLDIMKGIKSTMTGMVTVKDKDYDNLRTILKTIANKGLKE